MLIRPKQITRGSSLSYYPVYLVQIVRIATIFLSSLLLFLIQPIIVKTILPHFGGSAGVWTTCMLFFQVVLLFGYAYAHWTAGRLGPRTHIGVHSVLLASS